MATVLELARRANVPAAQVLRVLNGEPVRAEVEARVLEAIEELGAPPSTRGEATASFEPPVAPTSTPIPAPGNGAGDHPATYAAPIAAPDDLGRLMYEALRVEVRPIGEHVSHVGRLVDQLVGRLEQLQQETSRQRDERIEDLERLAELLTTGWKSVDRRLGRLERIVKQLADSDGGARADSRAEQD